MGYPGQVNQKDTNMQNGYFLVNKRTKFSVLLGSKISVDAFLSLQDDVTEWEIK